MATWYETMHWNDHINPVDVDRETEDFIYILGRRFAKISEYSRYFSTWEEAHTYLINRASLSIEDKTRDLETAKANLLLIEAMSKPEQA